MKERITQVGGAKKERYYHSLSFIRQIRGFCQKTV